MGRVGCPPNKSESMKFVQIGTEKVCEPRDGKLFCIALRLLSKGRFTLQWRSPPVMNSRGILKFDWPRAILLSSGGIHYGQEFFGGEHCTWMKK